jgi:DNA-binding MarR family transcriptional regulator
MPASNSGLDSAVSELRIVLGLLVRRLRADNPVPTSHLSVLRRLEQTGSRTTSALAAAEHMRPQSMAQTVADLDADGFVARLPDPDDRRQILIELTSRGQRVLVEERRRREDWLSRAIADELSPAEQELLVEAIPLLRRLAEL